MEIATIKIAGMQNEQCTEIINQALLAINGVEKAKTALSGQRTSVSFDESLTNVEVLKQAIRDTGYAIKLAHGEDGNCCGGCGG